MDREPTRAEALAAIPDRPPWVEARAIVLGGCGSHFRDDSGWVVRNEGEHGRIVILVGRPRVATLRRALGDRPDREVMCAGEDATHAAALLGDWPSERGLLYQLPASARLPPPVGVRLLAPADSLAHLPAALRQELTAARGDHAIHTAFVDGRAASFAYAHWRTEAQFDVSIDTASDFRRRGLTRRAASALITAELATGRQPVWGAMASNVASQRLAASLGFTHVGDIVVFRRAATPV